MILLAQFLILGAIAVSYVSYPAVYAMLIAEDNFGEYATAVSELIAATVFAALFMVHSEKRRNPWYLALAAGTFLVGMEEMSWGQRLAGVSTPGFLTGVNYQNEITIHNIRALNTITFEMLFGYAMIAYGVLLPILVAAHSGIRRALDRWRIPLSPLRLMPIFAASGYMLSEFLGMGLRLGTEVGELLFGLAFGFLALECAGPHLFGSHADSLRRTVPLYLMAVFGCATVLTLTAGSPQSYRRRMEDLAGPNYSGFLELMQAERVYPQILDRGYGSPSLLEERGRLLEKYDRTEEALRAYRQAIAELTDAPQLENLAADESFLLSRLYRSVGETDLSESFLDQSIRRYRSDIALDATPAEPSNSQRRIQLRISLAAAQLFAGRPEEALSVYFGLVDDEPWGYERQQMESSMASILTLLAECGEVSEIENLPRIDLAQISQMAAAYAAGSAGWCTEWQN